MKIYKSILPIGKGETPLTSPHKWVLIGDAIRILNKDLIREISEGEFPFVPVEEKGRPGGVATLNNEGQIPQEQFTIDFSKYNKHFLSKLEGIEKYQKTQSAKAQELVLQRIQELRQSLFDPDGYFTTDRIKPLSIETGMLSVGFKGAQMTIPGLQIEPNYTGDPNQIKISSATLHHLTIEDSLRTWELSEAGLISGLDPLKYYYLYAKCIRDIDLNTGTIIVDEAQIGTDQDGEYYHFLIGVLHSVIGGVRAISSTYGQTTINGRFITTGRIQSNDGQTYFDLDEGVFKGVFKFTNDQSIEDAIKAKSKNFVIQPTAPYYVGDTWVNEGVLYHCVTERLTGLFDASEWEISVEGGEGESVQTVIDGGIISSGRIELGDNLGNIWAGIHGGGILADSIRFWAGNTYAGRATAPFRVQQDGKMFATAGEIGGWLLEPNMLSKTSGDSKIEIDSANQRFRFLFQGERKIEISADVMPNITNLIEGNDVLYNTQTYSQIRAGYTSGSFTDYSSIFTIPSDFSQIKSNLRIRYTQHPYALSVSASIYVTVYLVNTSNTVIATLGSYSQFFSGTGDIVKETTYLVSNISAGSYKLRFSYDINDSSQLEFMGQWQEAPGEFLLGGDAVDSSCTVKSYDQFTMLGRNGLVSFHKNDRFFYLTSDASLVMLQTRGRILMRGSHETAGNICYFEIGPTGLGIVTSGTQYFRISGRVLASHPSGYKGLFIDSSGYVYAR